MPSMTEGAGLRGRVVLITGGNGGIGLGVARGAGHAGASVVICGRDSDKTDRATEELRAEGIEALGLSCDVTREGDIVRVVAATVERFGRLDGLVANAAVPGSDQTIVDMDLVHWREVLDVNLTGALLSFQHAAQQMMVQGDGGALLAISSIITSYGAPHKSHYAAAKAALNSLVRSAATELAPAGIRCNALSPGWTSTELARDGFGAEPGGRFESNIVRRTPVGRWGEPDDYAAVAALLLDPSLTFHTGDIITVDGGYSIA